MGMVPMFLEVVFGRSAAVALGGWCEASCDSVVCRFAVASVAATLCALWAAHAHMVAQIFLRGSFRGTGAHVPLGM